MAGGGGATWGTADGGSGFYSHVTAGGEEQQVTSETRVARWDTTSASIEVQKGVDGGCPSGAAVVYEEEIEDYDDELGCGCYSGGGGGLRAESGRGPSQCNDVAFSPTPSNRIFDDTRAICVAK
uniref:Uncharacterized protein n=1 Tax=Oryza glumipatula TaxID=40148 RepID=A0A0D9ZK37_9ORYZ